MVTNPWELPNKEYVDTDIANLQNQIDVLSVTSVELSANINTTSVNALGVRLPLTSTSTIIANGNINIPSTIPVDTTLKIVGVIQCNNANANGRVFFYNASKGQPMGDGYSFQSQKTSPIVVNYVVDNITLSPSDVLELRCDLVGGGGFQVTNGSNITISLPDSGNVDLSNYVLKDSLNGDYFLTMASDYTDNSSKATRRQHQVELRINVSKPTEIVSGEVIATIPPEVRPDGVIYFDMLGTSSDEHLKVSLSTTGELQVWEAGLGVSGQYRIQGTYFLPEVD